MISKDEAELDFIVRKLKEEFDNGRGTDFVQNKRYGNNNGNNIESGRNVFNNLITWDFLKKGPTTKVEIKNR